MRRVVQVLAGAAVLQALAVGPVCAADDTSNSSTDSPGAEVVQPVLPTVPAAASAAAVRAGHAGLADRLVDTLADVFVPLTPLLDADADTGAVAQRREAHANVRSQLQAHVHALVQVEVADRMRDPRADAVAARVLDRVQQLRRTAPLRWPASVREERFRLAFSAPDPQSACAAQRGIGVIDLGAIRQTIDAMFSTAMPLKSPQPELSLRLVDAVIEAMNQPGRIEPPFPEQAVSALGVGLGTSGDEGSRRTLCLVSFWWAQRALAKPAAARQADIDAYIHASVMGSPNSWPPLPDGLGEGAGGVLVGTAAPH